MLASALLATVLYAAQGRAQVGRRGQVRASPDYWVGLSYGYMDGATMVDGGTGATWQFGYSSQIRATIEKSLQPGIAAGLSGGFSTAPLTYSGAGFNTACGGSCRADADITQWLLFLRGGGGGSRGYGFHGDFDLEGGFTTFSNFREHSTSVSLPSTSHYDPTFGFGGELSYSLSPTVDIYVGEVADWVLHPQGDNVTASAPRVYTFRVGGRVGF